MHLRESFQKLRNAGALSTSVRTRRRIVATQVIGFTTIILISWLDELLNLPQLFSSDGTRWLAEGAIETLAVVFVAVPSITITGKLLARMQELESFLRMCAWCKKVHGTEGWMTLDEFIASHTETTFTHGMCEGCAEQMLSLRVKHHSR